jgi:HD-GYP domain-containing protein (c-di-GMP phosphodiesterase class II)
MRLRFRTRAFLICFIPFALLLTCGFAMMQRFVQARVRDGLRSSLRANELAIARAHARSDLQNSRFLKVVGENAALKAGVQLLASEPHSPAARSTVEDQLRELGEHMGFDFLLVSAPDGTPLAGVTRGGGGLVPIQTAGLKRISKGFVLMDGRAFEVGSVPMDANEENIGMLSVGSEFDFSEFTTSAVLLRNNQVIQSNLTDVRSAELNAAMQGCVPRAECDLRLRNANWISMPVESEPLGDGFELRTLQDVDAAIGPLAAVLHNIFVFVALASVLVALLCGLLSSRSIVQPIAKVVEKLRRSAATGVLAEFDERISSVVEIRELVENYNSAAVAVREAREDLQDAYIEFVGSLANALDARDRYTAGHSKRVSDLASATAAALHLAPDAVERIRIGALLHDIGKIGVADSVLQKTGRLTDEEFELVKEHPVIGRWILEGVQGLTPFIPAVELHHENWDGTGYPKGQSAHQTPVDARIIHIADAYDAMTTDRSYRRGLTHERAIEILFEYAGTQFDPYIVPAFANLPREMMAPQRTGATEPASTNLPLDAWETA